MIKIEHSIFALPFALLGMIWGAESQFKLLWPTAITILWIIVAMVSCRSAAMAFNRIADREIDAKNPRTKMRAIPAGLLTLRQSNLFFLGSIAVFVLAAWQLNTLALALTPVALLFTLGYSLTKRFTWLCHYVLGLSLGIAPAAAYIATTGSLEWPVVSLFLAVACWTAGFDIIYALQDDEFDREMNLNSIPSRFGRPRALLISRISHGVAIALLVLSGIGHGAGFVYFIGVGVAAALLGYEQSLVRPNDLSKVNMAFFTLNGYVSMAMFLFALADTWLRLKAR
ncbi:MAG: UbiA family prenyltransferase [Armatimonadetes bacterium]|nr:UbiA family prenyltransferase [Armatimonadota bacterium]